MSGRQGAGGFLVIKDNVKERCRNTFFMERTRIAKDKAGVKLPRMAMNKDVMERYI